MVLNKKLAIYLILIGVGIGIIIGTSINILNPTIVYMDYTDDEIRSKAKDLGMIDLKENIAQNMEDIKKQEEQEEIDREDSAYEDNTITFEIKKGEASGEIIDNLFQAQLITNKEEFKSLVVEKEAAKRFQYGIYEIEKNIDYDTLIEVLTR